MGVTTNYSLRYPEGENAVVVHTDIKKLADDVDATIFVTAPTPSLLAGVLLGAIRSAAVLDGGSPHSEHDEYWELVCGQPICDCGFPGSGTPEYVFDGGAV